tara:strand:+ start:69 stop:290 length:222 start_codon:yes stop_codon:yes gene_type:complete
MFKINIISLFFSLSILFSAEYEVGDIVDQDDQNRTFSVCNGDYYNSSFSLADLNGDLNGGHYFVTWFDISATW